MTHPRWRTAIVAELTAALLAERRPKRPDQCPRHRWARSIRSPRVRAEATRDALREMRERNRILRDKLALRGWP